MTYPHLQELPSLIERKLISARPHPRLPLKIYNYTAQATYMPIAEWTECLKDCRGLILDADGTIVGRPFRKFWNYEQVLDQTPDEPFTIWEKMDGSLGIVCSYAGERVVATRGSFESDQSKWFGEWLTRKHSSFLPSDVTYLFEIVYPENRIVVDYGPKREAVLLAVMSRDGVDLPVIFDRCEGFTKPARFDGMRDFALINSDPQFAGMEGFVVQWRSGFRAKVKLEEYKRLHRLITQCSSRTIWELMRSGGDTQELLDRVPADFLEWATGQIRSLSDARRGLLLWAGAAFNMGKDFSNRKDFAEYAKKTDYPGLLFSMLDGKDITDAVWKLIEPKWATPFRKDIDA